MIKVNNIVPKGIINGVTSYKIDFEFDNASALPIKVYQVGLSSYILADESSAFNTIDNDTYIYRDGKWNKTPGVKPDKVSNINNITKNGNYSIPNNDAIGINNVNVNVKSSGDNELSDVVFYDYDGTILYEYTKEEFLTLKEMPKEHTRKGLISRGWNWDFESAHNYVEKYGVCDIGQQYETDDGSTRIYLTIPDEWEDNIPPISLGFNISADSEVAIDWGDGSEIETITTEGIIKSSNHIYETVGEHKIVIKPIKGIIKLTKDDGIDGISRPYNTCVHTIEVGDENIINGMRSLDFCTSLKNLMLSSTITNISSTVFSGWILNLISHITIPKSCTSLENVFSDDYHTGQLHTVSLPDTFEVIGEMLFQGCANIFRILVPETVTEMGEDAFRRSGVVYLNMVDNVEVIGESMCSECERLQYIRLPSSMTSIPSYMFDSCISLTEIKIPETVTDIGYGAFNDSNLTHFEFPNNPDAFNISALESCIMLRSITVPSSVTEIEDDAFSSHNFYAPSLSTIIINKPEDSISGAPWGAPDYVQIIWNDEA